MGRSKERWEGGWVRVTRAGRRVFVILRRINGKLYERATGASTRASALVQLERFEADPEGYTPAPIGADRLTLSADLVRDFLKWSLDEKKNTPEWVREQRRVLGWWADQLGAKDLRKLSLRDDILPVLKGEKARGQRIAVLKTLFSWLRFEQHELTLPQDPLVGQLRAPKTRPEQWRRPKALEIDDLVDVHKTLVRPYADALELQLGTGWHATEVRRWARGEGGTEPLPRGREGEGAAVLRLDRHKSGKPHRAIVSARVLEAAERLRGHGALSLQYYRRSLAAAALVVTEKRREAVGPQLAKKVRALVLQPGAIRHTVATFAKNAGAELEAIADFLGHDSKETTDRFYSTHGVPAKVPTPR